MYSDDYLAAYDRALLEEVAAKCHESGAYLVVDECFIEFTDGQSLLPLLEKYPRLLLLRAFTKTYAMAGIRLGFLLCADVVQTAQLYIAQTHDLKADIFKWPHHGLNKVYREFWENVDAEYAFITHGYMNTMESQAQLNKYGIPHDFATWGVIHLSTDGDYWLVDQQLNEMGERCVEMYR